MTFLHISLIAGAATIAVPIALHLFGQRQPKVMDFPALRFVRQTAQEKRSSWQLRHILLLLLRILLLALVALALARPRVHSALLGSSIGISLLAVVALLVSVAAAVTWVTGRNLAVRIIATTIAAGLWLVAAGWLVSASRGAPSIPGGDADAPIAAAIIVDNGPPMQYIVAGETRLEKAKDFAGWILGKLPKESRVGILAGAPIGALSLSPVTGQAQVDAVQALGVSVDLVSRIQTAVELVLKEDLDRKEVYVVTDLSKAGWQSEDQALLTSLAEYRDEVLVQIIDIGDEANTNWALGNVDIDLPVAYEGADINFTVPVTSPADAEQSPVSVELVSEVYDPSYPTNRQGERAYAARRVIDRKIIDIGAGETVQVSLKATSVVQPTNNFIIRLNQQDPLALDNERYVSIPTFRQRPTLMVATDRRIGQLLTALVDPNARAADSKAAQVQYVQLADTALENYDVVCLYDPPMLSDSALEKLRRHVAGGGGLLVILGPQLAASAGKANAMNALLPGPLDRVVDRSSASAFFDITAPSDPILAELGEWADSAEWNRLPVKTNWQLGELTESARIIARYQDNQNPAVIAHDVGRGQVITFTTPIPEPDLRQRPLWNFMWANDEPYATFGLLLGALRVLSGADMSPGTFTTGQAVVLDNEVQRWPTAYSYYPPLPLTNRNLPASEGAISVAGAEATGLHYLRGVRSGKPVLRSFACNTPAEATALERMDSESLDMTLGEDNYRIARRRDDVESSIGYARFGRELFPMLMAIVAAVFVAEQAMSNRFYSVKFSGSASGRKGK